MQRIPQKHKYHHFYVPGSLKTGEKVIDRYGKIYVVLPCKALKRISPRRHE